MVYRQTARQGGIAFISSYVPRLCGIATFASDLVEATAHEVGDSQRLFVVAMNDVPEGYRYPSRVKFEIRQNIQGDYVQAADFLNFSAVEAVSVQHEFGIYGGDDGSHILALLRELKAPVVTSLHTILETPSPSQRQVFEELVSLSNALVVMSHRSVKMLEEIYKIPREKMFMIPHGIPDIPFVDPSYYKERFNVEGKKVIFTFGLIGPGKGLETVIEAMPAIVTKHPDTVYIILGATHPFIKRQSGEEYRLMLTRKAKHLDVGDHIIFQNRFVSLEELCEFLGCADIYVSPYLARAQAVSGTLSYALGAGKAVVSTPSWYAEEILAEDRGVLVPFQNPGKLGEAIIQLLDNETACNAMRRRAYAFGRQMIWKEIARQHLDLFKQVRAGRGQPTPVVFREKSVIPATHLPEPKLDHLGRLSDDTGLLQHARYSIPDPKFGYTLDDNARALVVTAKYWRIFKDAKILPLLSRYLTFTAYCQRDDGKFHNNVRYDRKFDDDVGSDDCFGRALWGLGYVIAFAPQNMKPLAKECFDRAIPNLKELNLRGAAYALLGLHYYLDQYPGASDARRWMHRLARHIVAHFETQSKPHWPWFEPILTYDNGVIPQSLLLANLKTGEKSLGEVGKKTLHFLFECVLRENHVSLVGNEGWHSEGSHRASFDQQPIDACGLAEAAKVAYRSTSDKHYLRWMWAAFEWFLGNNDLGVALYDFSTGGCYDGLTPTGVNQNQGAESTLSFLLSLLTMSEIASLEVKRFGPLEATPRASN